MVIREHYLKQIRPFYDSDLVKIITGIRRCGKSVILNQVQDEIKAEGNKCLFLDFDLKPTRNMIPDADALINYVNENIGEEKLYLFLDEIQNVKGWNEACRTLRLYNCSVFISGSNSKLLSKEFTKELSGRYISFRVRPFVYKEALEYASQTGKKYSITDYLVWGGFPAALEQDNINAKRRYLNDLNDTIVYNDLENRYKIRKKEEFERIVDFILISNARVFSAKSIADYMKGKNISVSVPTVIKYLEYLSGSRYDLTHNLENVVLNELLYMGYEVTVYDNKGREIDFRAKKDGKIYLIQVAYSVAEEKAYEREFSAFSNIDNSVKKIIITNDDIDYSTSTIYHYKLTDFLLMKEL